jgi:hypothetical protein
MADDLLTRIIFFYPFFECAYLPGALIVSIRSRCGNFLLT